MCAEQGIIAEANPTFSGEWGARFFIVGQAPGPSERESRRPFSGRAGKELDRWMMRAGFRDAEEFRRLTYIAALMRCFPGRNKKNTGDLPPPRTAIANCAHWLDEELRLLKPKVLIPIGQLANHAISGTGGARRPRRQSLRREAGHHPAAAPVRSEPLAQRARQPRTAGESPRTDRRAAINICAVRYLLVYYGGGMPETPAQQARVMKQWTTWFTRLGPAIVDPGNPFSGSVNKIKPDGTVAKGPVGQRASGYSIIEAPSLAAATKLAKGCPVIKSGAQVAVYETFNVM